MSELIQISNLKDYSKCSNFAKYNWNSKVKPVVFTPGMKVIDSCYRDLVLLDKVSNWKTVRNRANKYLMESQTEISAAQFYSDSINLLENLRNWYRDFYSDLEVSGISNLDLSVDMFNQTITGHIDTVVIKKGKPVLIEYTNLNTIDQLVTDIGIRTKIWLLSKNGIKVKTIYCVSPREKTLSVIELNIDNFDTWNNKTEVVLQLMVTSIKNKIFYPSPTNMCTTCKYKDVCSW
jgi:CRISPR/Cas system-associated exonuclease Cas4 (RecB family)